VAIIWDENDQWGPGKHDRCVMCRGRLSPPLVMWFTSFRGGDDAADDELKFICSECCAEMGRGLSDDMRQIATAREVQHLGFHRAGKRAAVSGGFLIKEITTTKQ
jgi:hypothetical protein